MDAFDAAASAVFPGGRISASGSVSTLRALDGVVATVVDRCGFQVMVDVANQYDRAVFGTLIDSAALALGALAAEPAGLRCADLKSIGYGAKDSVDYWFYWGSPPLMDADLDGIPCETVFADVARFMPAYW
jgi:hypothetical protein